VKRLSTFNVVSLTFGFAFLYIPMLILVIYSFKNEAFLEAAWVTVRVAFFSSVIATVLGTMAAYALVRSGRFFGRTLFSGMVYAPIVMPEVITGLSLLLLFISLDMHVWQALIVHLKKPLMIWVVPVGMLLKVLPYLSSHRLLLQDGCWLLLYHSVCHYSADKNLFISAAWRESRDQRTIHHNYCDCYYWRTRRFYSFQACVFEKTK